MKNFFENVAASWREKKRLKAVRKVQKMKDECEQDIIQSKADIKKKAYRIKECNKELAKLEGSIHLLKPPAKNGSPKITEDLKVKA